MKQKEELLAWLSGRTITKVIYENHILDLVLNDGTHAIIYTDTIVQGFPKDKKPWADPLKTHPLADVLYAVSYAPVGVRAAARRKALEEIEKYYEEKNATS